MDDKNKLCNSLICRLCSESNLNGSYLFTQKEDDVANLINSYLPVKISNDGNYPRWICPGCRLQVEATVEFFDLVINGQERLRLLLKQQQQSKKLQPQQQLGQQQNFYQFTNNTKEMKKTDSTIVGVVNNNVNSLIIKASNSDSLFKINHDLRFKMDGIEKPKRKRGRPTKPTIQIFEQDEQLIDELDGDRKKQENNKKKLSKLLNSSHFVVNDDNDDDDDGIHDTCDKQRRKRQIKLPIRYQETIKGKELEQILIEKGVIDKSESLLNQDDYSSFINENDVTDCTNSVIGHVIITNQDNNKNNLLINRRNLYKSKSNGKFICDICRRGFIHEFRYLTHRATHHVRFECTECVKQFNTRNNLVKHQQLANHTGEGVIENLEDEDFLLPMENNENDVNNFSKNDKNNIDNDNCDGVDVLSDMDKVLDDINHIEEAAKVLYGLHIDKYDQSSITNEYINDNGVVDYTNDSGGNVDTSTASPSFVLELTADQSTPVLSTTTEPIKLDDKIQTPLLDYQLFLKDSPPPSPIQKLITNRHDCSKCNKSFTNNQQLSIHYRLIHENAETYLINGGNNTRNDSSIRNCNNKTTISSSSLQPQNNEFKYQCDQCPRKFKTPSSVLYHKESEHNFGRRFVCNKCGKIFKHKQLLQRHQMVHTDYRPFPCEICGSSFKTKPNLLNHLQKHSGEKKFECTICQQWFAHKTSLKLHYRWHAGSKPFVCKECGKQFTQNGNLQEHIRIHTGERPYTCTHCGKMFKTSSQCRIHSKRHTNYKPYECTICLKTFLNFDIFRTHLRRHNNEKPFTCTYCTKSFSEQWALRKHCRTHTGEKPYQCSVCKKSFADCSNLTKHKKTHEKVTEILDDGDGGVVGLVTHFDETDVGTINTSIKTNTIDNTNTTISTNMTAANITTSSTTAVCNINLDSTINVDGNVWNLLPSTSDVCDLENRIIYSSSSVESSSVSSSTTNNSKIIYISSNDILHGNKMQLLSQNNDDILDINNVVSTTPYCTTVDVRNNEDIPYILGNSNNKLSSSLNSQQLEYTINSITTNDNVFSNNNHHQNNHPMIIENNFNCDDG